MCRGNLVHTVNSVLVQMKKLEKSGDSDHCIDRYTSDDDKSCIQKAVKTKYIAAKLRKLRTLKTDEQKMEEDFQQDPALSDDIFDALNSSDTELTGDKKLSKSMHELYDAHDLKSTSYPTPPQSSYKQSEVMFPRILPEKPGNSIDEFLSFNSAGKMDKSEDHVTDDNYLNMAMLSDSYPKIDLNGMTVEKPVDVVVGLPDNFVIRNFNMADGEKQEMLHENRYSNDFILGDSDFLTSTNLLTTKQLADTQCGSNLMNDHVFNLDFTGSQMFLNRNSKPGGSKSGDNVDFALGAPNSINLNYGDGAFCFMEDVTKPSVDKQQVTEFGFDDGNHPLTDIDVNLNTNYVFSAEEDKFIPTVRAKTKLKPDSKRGMTNDEDDEYKPFDYKCQNKRINDFNKENLTHYVRYQNLGDRSVKLWQCGVCKKDFRHQYTLTRHLPTHTDERNYKCETCGKAFRQMSTLSQHRAIHSDARPYVCEFCRKTFNRVSTLISHKKTHNPSKPHECHICGKAFHQKGNLRNHIFTHTNERPYKCDICSKGFNQMSNLMCHKAHTHSEKGMYPCMRCGQVFNKRFSLRTHEENVHGIKYPSREVSSDEKKNVRMHVQNENRTTQFRAGPVNRSPLQRLNVTKTSVTDRGVVTEKSMVVGIVIDLIKTKAMETAKENGQMPFALFRPSGGIPVLVKVLKANAGTQHMLVPATPEDLKLAGTITVAPNNETTSVKMVQIKVPVVATVIQTFDELGKMQIEVEPPGPELENQNNELQKNSNNNSAPKIEPEIFCEPMDSGNEFCQEPIPPIDPNNVQLLSLEEAKRIFKHSKDLYEEDVNSNCTDLMMTFTRNGECTADDQNYVSSTNNIENEEILGSRTQRTV